MQTAAPVGLPQRERAASTTLMIVKARPLCGVAHSKSDRLQTRLREGMLAPSLISVNIS